jgi:L-threonylcarbamoyladenylate synthase
VRSDWDRTTGADLVGGTIETLVAGRDSVATIAERVATVVFGGGVVIFPTDTVYGLGCDPMRADSVARVYALKVRDAGKPLTLHVATVAEALEYAGGDRFAAFAIRRLLPGPVTLIVRRPSFIDERVTAGLGTMGLRVPDLDLCSAILERSGPLAATSANRSGSAAFTGESEATGLPAADLMVDAGPTRYLRESTVVDISAGTARLVRQGAMTLTMLEQTLGRIARPLSP